MAGHGRFVAGDVMRHLRQRLRVDAAGDRRFAGVAGELLEQLEVGEAQADDLDSAEHLVRAGREDRLRFVKLQLVRPDQLHGSLFVWNAWSRHKSFSGSVRRICSGVASRRQPAQAVFGRRLQVAPEALEEGVLGGGAGEVFLAQGLR